MNCAAVKSRLVAWQDDELSPGEHTRVGEHLDRCASCRGLERDLAAVTPEPAAPIPAEATTALFAQMDRALATAWSRPASRAARGRSPRWSGETTLPLGAVLAYAALLLLTMAWGTYNWREARSLEVALAASHPVTTGRVIPARTAVGDLSSEQFAPAAWVPEHDAPRR